jgi:hypothetical protein
MSDEWKIAKPKESLADPSSLLILFADSASEFSTQFHIVFLRRVL